MIKDYALVFTSLSNLQGAIRLVSENKTMKEIKPDDASEWSQRGTPNHHLITIWFLYDYFAINLLLL